MSNLRSICRPQVVFSSMTCCCRSITRVPSIETPSNNFRVRSYSPVFAVWFDRLGQQRKNGPRLRLNQHRRMVATRASNWTDHKSPYETLELERDADEEQIKIAYRRLAKFYHPDVYDGRGTLEEGETAEARFIKIQAAYELLVDDEKRRRYDTDNRVNPLKASQAWMEWLMKKRKAFDQRGDMAVAAWAEQQQLELNLRARRLARSKIDPEEERKILVKEKKASLENACVYFNFFNYKLVTCIYLFMEFQIDPEEERKILVKEKKASLENFNSTLKRHTLVLRKRDLTRKKAAEEKKKIIGQLLAAEGLELENDLDEDNL